MKRNMAQNAASSSGNSEEEPTSEKTTKKQRRTRSDKNYKNEEEIGKLARKLTESALQRGLVW